MALALPCTSCGCRLPKFQKFFYQMSCTGSSDISNQSDVDGNCFYWISVLDAETDIQKAEKRKAEAIARMKAPLSYNPFVVLKEVKAKVEVTKKR